MVGVGRERERDRQLGDYRGPVEQVLREKNGKRCGNRIKLRCKREKISGLMKDAPPYAGRSNGTSTPRMNSRTGATGP